jgi:hypothetical protein
MHAYEYSPFSAVPHGLESSQLKIQCQGHASPAQQRQNFIDCNFHQGCQIFPGTKYQNGEKYVKWPQNIPNGHKISLMAVKYTKWS